MQRRDFLDLTALGGGAVFASGLAGCASRAGGVAGDRRTSTSCSSPTPTGASRARRSTRTRAARCRKAVAAVNALAAAARLHRLHRRPHAHHRRPGRAPPAPGGVQATSSPTLKVKNVRFMPGEHDASLDHGAACKEFFGETHYTFDHKGVHFIALDNVSDPRRADRRRAARLARRPTSRKQPKDAPHRRAHAPAAVRPGARSGTGPRATARRRSSC